MTSDDSPSRIPVPKRTSSFASRGAESYAAYSVLTRSGSHTQSMEPRRRRGERRQRTVVAVQKEWVVAGLMGAVLIVAIIGLWAVGRKHAGTGESPAVMLEHSESPARAAKWHGPIPSVIAERFTEASSHEQRLELIRNPANVGPAMEAFFKNGPGATEQIEGLVPMANGASGDLVFESYSVKIAGAPPRVLSVLVDPDGAKVDFECYARCNSVAWQDLLTGKVAEASEVRVVLQSGGYYQNEFKDEQKWLHFRASSPDLMETMDFYLDRQDPAVRDILESGLPAFQATLSVRSVNDSEKHRQFEITAIKALNWVEPS